MPHYAVTADSRLKLAQSVRILERHRVNLSEALGERMVALEDREEPFGQGDVTALQLTDLLIECARDLAAFGDMRDLRTIAADHERIGIDGRHYSRFGVALEPILRELIGPQLSPPMITACCDAFWLLVRKIGRDSLPRGPGRVGSGRR
jgi:hemoglobin-like flavoprotein